MEFVGASGKVIHMDYPERTPEEIAKEIRWLEYKYNVLNPIAEAWAKKWTDCHPSFTPDF